jgi:MFS family permease
MQMSGLLMGGLLWGILGDKRGRLSVLFGSILLYSLANLANAAVTGIPMYGVLRFIAGVGLAGELGAAVTLVSETLPVSKRGYGTALVAGIGILGAIFAWFVADKTSWRIAYVLGGLLGLALLALRVSVSESGMFRAMDRNKSEVKRGDLRLLFASRERIKRYLACILIGVPTWVIIGVFVTFAPEFAAELGVKGPITAGSAIAFCYAGTSVGGMVAGALSQIWMSRKRALLVFMGFSVMMAPVYLNCVGVSSGFLDFIFVLLGFGAGYWSVFMTISAEQFGTNLRATVATTVPNFVRGSVVPVTALVQLLRTQMSLRESAGIVAAGAFVMAFWAISVLDESSQKDLDYLEV